MSCHICFSWPLTCTSHPQRHNNGNKPQDFIFFFGSTHFLAALFFVFFLQNHSINNKRKVGGLRSVKMVHFPYLICLLRIIEHFEDNALCDKLILFMQDMGVYHRKKTQVNNIIIYCRTSFSFSFLCMNVWRLNFQVKLSNLRDQLCLGQCFIKSVLI